MDASKNNKYNQNQHYRYQAYNPVEPLVLCEASNQGVVVYPCFFAFTICFFDCGSKLTKILLTITKKWGCFFFLLRTPSSCTSLSLCSCISQFISYFFPTPWQSITTFTTLKIFLIVILILLICNSKCIIINQLHILILIRSSYIIILRHHILLCSLFFFHLCL